jgi:type I restriction enzyme S subunit
MSELPSNWRREKLENITNSITVGHVGSTSEFYRNEGVLFLRTGNLNSGKITLDDVRYVDRKFHESLKKSTLQEGDVLVSRVGYTGNAALVPENFPEANCANIIIIRPKSFVNPEYLHIFINSSVGTQQNASLTAGSAQAVLNTGAIKNLVAIIPTLEEQQKIAKILSTVDNLIEKTQTLIDKYTAIKQGMMADLFTRGIDMTTGGTPNSKGGKLRPSVEDAPELYKQTELGWVPKEWEVCSLKEKIEGDGFVQTGPFGSQLHSYEYVESGVPVVMPQDIIEGVISFEKMAQITEDKANSLSRHKVKANDVIFSRRGDLTRSAYIANELNNIGFICGTGCLLLRVSSLMVHGGWFSTLYGTRFIQSQVDGLAVGTTMANLNSKILGKLLVAFPPVKEQKFIYERIELIDRRLKLFQHEVEEHRKIKKGLMQDLLTGKVRVN